MYYTTLRRLHDIEGDDFDFDRLLSYLGKTEADDDPLSLLTILEINGLDDAISALVAVDDPACARDARIFGARCVRQVQHLLTDQRSLDVAESHAVGEATDEELDAARRVALAAVRFVAWYAVWIGPCADARDAQRQDFINIFCS